MLNLLQGKGERLQITLNSYSNGCLLPLPQPDAKWSTARGTGFEGVRDK